MRISRLWLILLVFVAPALMAQPAAVATTDASLSEVPLAEVPLIEVPGVGDPAPDFTLIGSDGVEYTLSQFKDEKPVVIAFFPKAFTGG
jgi:cytochrome oxidase Cu insertion factor (SCO1/SenC/PrrC family)